MTIESIKQGATVEIRAGDDDLPIFITMNSHKVKIFNPLVENAYIEKFKVTEIFVRIDSKEHFEIVQLITRLASMTLRSGVEGLTIAKELQSVYSMTNQHIIPGTTILCPSIIARIGYELEKHINSLNGE